MRVYILRFMVTEELSCSSLSHARKEAEKIAGTVRESGQQIDIYSVMKKSRARQPAVPK